MLDKNSLKWFFKGVNQAKEPESSLGLDSKILDMVLNGMGDAMCLFDRDFNILFQTHQHIKWFDKLEEFICFKRLDEDGQNRTVKTITNETGAPLHLEVSTFPIKDSAGELYAGINIVRDISQVIEEELKSNELVQFKQRSTDKLGLKNILGNSKAIL